MKALSIANPYPCFILDPVEELPPGIERKRTENRTWNMAYRGPLLIHASKSRNWLAGVKPEQLPATMHFGYLVGVVDVVDCVSFKPYMSRRVQQIPADAQARYPWLLWHRHASGPHCIIMENPRRFISPIPYRGAQGLFNVPDSVVAEQMRKVA